MIWPVPKYKRGTIILNSFLYLSKWCAFLASVDNFQHDECQNRLARSEYIWIVWLYFHRFLPRISYFTEIISPRIKHISETWVEFMKKIHEIEHRFMDCSVTADGFVSTGCSTSIDSTMIRIFMQHVRLIFDSFENPIIITGLFKTPFLVTSFHLHSYMRSTSIFN